MDKILFNGSVDQYFEGYISSKDGNIGGLSEYYWSTGYISVNEGDVVIFPMSAPPSLGACYDDNKKYILGINSNDLDENLNYVIKAGVKFIRVSIEKAKIEKNISNYILYVIYKSDEEREEVISEECRNICERLEALEERIEVILITQEDYNELKKNGLLEEKFYFIV